MHIVKLLKREKSPIKLRLADNFLIYRYSLTYGKTGLSEPVDIVFVQETQINMSDYVLLLDKDRTCNQLVFDDAYQYQSYYNNECSLRNVRTCETLRIPYEELEARCLKINGSTSGVLHATTRVQKIELNIIDEHVELFNMTRLQLANIFHHRQTLRQSIDDYEKLCWKHYYGQ